MALVVGVIRTKKYFSIKIFAVLLSFLMGPASAFSLSIKHVELLSDTVDFDEGIVAKVQFVLSDSAVTQLKIYDARDFLVHETDKRHYAKGEHIIEWNGMTSSGERVPPEAYIYTLTAKNAEDEVVYDIADYTGGERVKPRNVQWLNERNIVRYDLPDNARVNIRAGINNGPLLVNIMNWAPRKAGTHTVKWNGYDADNTIDLSEHTNLRLVADAFSLPDNLIYVNPEVNHPEYMERVSENMEKREAKKSSSMPRVHPVAKRQAESRVDYSVKIEIDKANSGVIPVHISVPDKFRPIVSKSRFEVVVFLDGVFLYENEVAFLPMSYQLKKEKLSKGEHYLTVNIMGYDGNFGFATEKLLVD